MHVSAEQLREITRDQNARQKQRVSSRSYLINGRDGPLGRPSASARPAVAPYANLGFSIYEMASNPFHDTHSFGATNTSLLGKVRNVDSGLLKFVARTSTGLPAIHAERSIDW